MFIDPTVILVSTKIDDAVVERFDPELRTGASVSDDNDQFRLPFVLEVRPPSEFHYDTAKTKLVSLRLGQEDGTRINLIIPGELATIEQFGQESTAGQQGQLLRLAGWIDLDSRLTVRGVSTLKTSLLLTCG
jgi:DNA mismatch repair protein MSH5